MLIYRVYTPAPGFLSLLSPLHGQLLPLTARRGSVAAEFPALSGHLAGYAADLITGYSDDDFVSIWPDTFSGSSRDLTSSTTARPVYKTGIVNGLPVVRFNNSAVVPHSMTATVPIVGLTALTIYAVCSTVKDNRIPFAFSATDRVELQRVTPDVYGYVDYGNNGSYAGGTDPKGTTEIVRWCWRYDGSASAGSRLRIFADGVEITLTPAGTFQTSIPAGSDTLCVGNSAPGQLHSIGGDYCEFHAFSAAHTTGEMADMNAYLARWS